MPDPTAARQPRGGCTGPESYLLERAVRSLRDSSYASGSSVWPNSLGGTWLDVSRFPLSPEFFEAVRSAAQASRRTFTEVETTAHPVDHPATFPEAQYLKCIYLRL